MRSGPGRTLLDGLAGLDPPEGPGRDVDGVDTLAAEVLGGGPAAPAPGADQQHRAVRRQLVGPRGDVGQRHVAGTGDAELAPFVVLADVHEQLTLRQAALELVQVDLGYVQRASCHTS